MTQVFTAALEQRQASSPTEATIAKVEQEMRELLRQMGAQALSQFLSLGAGTPRTGHPDPPLSLLAVCILEDDGRKRGPWWSRSSIE